jgi:hypothetical protein
VAAEHVVWYPPQAKRTVKYTVATRVGNVLRESTTFGLAERRVDDQDGPPHPDS